MIIVVLVAIKLTYPECFTRATTSRDENKYSFSLEFEFFNFSHMIELLESQNRDIKSLVNMTRKRGNLISDLCFNTEYLGNDEQYEILRSTKDLNVQLESGILFLGNGTCAFLRTETILECSHLNRLYSLHLPTSPQKLYFTLQDDHIKLTGKQAQHKIICHNNSINVNLHSLISTESLSLMESISSLRKFGQAINLFSKTKRTNSEILLGSLGTYFLQNLITQNTGPSTAQSLALFSKVQRLTTTLITDLQLEIFDLENERVQNTISKLKSQELSRTLINTMTVLSNVLRCQELRGVISTENTLLRVQKALTEKTSLCSSLICIRQIKVLIQTGTLNITRVKQVYSPQDSLTLHCLPVNKTHISSLHNVECNFHNLTYLKCLDNILPLVEAGSGVFELREIMHNDLIYDNIFLFYEEETSCLTIQCLTEVKIRTDRGNQFLCNMNRQLMCGEITQLILEDNRVISIYHIMNQLSTLEKTSKLMETKLDVIKGDLESIETALDKKNKSLQILKIQQEQERSLATLTNSSPQTALTWIFISLLFLFLCYGLMKSCQKYKGAVNLFRRLLGKDPSLLDRTRNSKVTFTKSTEDLTLFDTSKGSLTQASSPKLRLIPEHFQNQRPEMILMKEQSKNQRLSQNLDSPAALSRKLSYGSKNSLTSEHSYYERN